MTGGEGRQLMEVSLPAILLLSLMLWGMLWSQWGYMLTLLDEQLVRRASQPYHDISMSIHLFVVKFRRGHGVCVCVGLG